MMGCANGAKMNICNAGDQQTEKLLWKKWSKMDSNLKISIVSTVLTPMLATTEVTKLI